MELKLNNMETARVPDLTERLSSWSHGDVSVLKVTCERVYIMQQAVGLAQTTAGTVSVQKHRAADRLSDRSEVSLDC